MARIFLDTNIFIDSIHRRPENKILELLEGSNLYVSTLSLHIYCYTFKIKTPNREVNEQRNKFQLVDLSASIIDQALQGPTIDLEDNVQLHSAAEAESDVFLTADKDLLKMKFFGKTRISSEV